MLKSMTGYGRSAAVIDGYDIRLEIRSVNNRYLDVNVRIPRLYGYLEEKIKKQIQTRVSRGKVDIFLSLERPAGESQKPVLDEALAQGLVSILKDFAARHNLKDDVSVTAIARFPDVLVQKPVEEDEDTVWQAVSGVLDEALDRFISMRATEGENLYRDLSARLDTLEGILQQILALSGSALTEYRAGLEKKLREYLEDREIDQGRLLTEVGIIADKIDTGEETTRLASHILQFRDLILQDAPSGRTLDFLVQEMNREVNTIGSKCSLLEITNLVIQAKNEIERIREQIQNIE